MRKESDTLQTVPLLTIEPHAISFLKMIYEHLPTEDDMKVFIGKVINGNPVSREDKEGVCSSHIDNWGGYKIHGLIQ